ncbi:MAG: 2-dehydropantoate 2-reductase [Chloroflexota bacterium]|nr:2-dehydropantoate 2-reductase [Chloroflexota bacterium]
MKIAIVGADGVGLLFGAWLAEAGQDVTLIDRDPAVVNAITAAGVLLVDLAGGVRAIPTRTTTDPARVGPVDLVAVCVKYYETEAAVRAAAPLIAGETALLSLQSGWGDAPRIAGLVGAARVLVGLTDHEVGSLGHGGVAHKERGMTVIGELDGRVGDRLARVTETLGMAGIEVVASAEVVREAWLRLALDAAAQPVRTLLRYSARQLLEHAGTLSLMGGLLRESVAVAGAQGLALDYDERWGVLMAALERTPAGEARMQQDLETNGRTDVDAINGAVVAAGRRLGIPTPYNEAMLWLIRAQERRDDGVQ